MGLFGDVGKALGIGKGGGTLIGAGIGFALGGPAGAMVGASLGGAADGMNAPKPKTGGGGGDSSAAYAAQRDAAIATANASKYTADKQFQLGQMELDNALQQSKMSALGGIITGAMAANQDQTVRKQLLPHEAGAATILSHDLAQQWNKQLAMKNAGYQDVAINYEMMGRNGQALRDDAQWSALNMMQQTKKDNLASVQMFGIKSDSNPNGIDIPEEEWLAMHTFKDPKEILQVDPAEAAQRNAAYAKWKEDMYKSGNDLVVQMYENPQLAGNNIMTMKGKDALIDERLAPLVKAMNSDNTQKLQAQMQSELDAIDAKAPQWRNTSANTGPGKGFYFNPDGTMIVDGMQGGHKLTAADAYKFQMEKINKEKQAIRNKYQNQISQSAKDKGIWDQAINAATKGEQNQYTDQIKKLQKEGVIDQYGMINAAALNKFIPPELMAAPNFKVQNELSEEEKIKLKDEYNKLANKKIDEKLIRHESLGGGITRKIILNPDGTRAGSVLEGYMTDKMGNSHFVSMQGDRAQDFLDRSKSLSGYTGSPTQAMSSTDERAGKTVKSSSWNYNAKADVRGSGNTAVSQVNGIAPKAAAPKPKAPTQAPAAAAPKLAAPAAPNPAASAGGAPLAAGE